MSSVDLSSDTTVMKARNLRQKCDRLYQDIKRVQEVEQLQDAASQFATMADDSEKIAREASTTLEAMKNLQARLGSCRLPTNIQRRRDAIVAYEHRIDDILAELGRFQLKASSDPDTAVDDSVVPGGRVSPERGSSYKSLHNLANYVHTECEGLKERLAVLRDELAAIGDSFGGAVFQDYPELIEAVRKIALGCGVAEGKIAALERKL